MPTTQTEDGKTIITPLLHLNGSSGEHLLDGYRKALDSIRGAIQAAAATGPNARDYYPQCTQQISDAFKIARIEHDARVRALKEVAEQFELLVSDVDAQQTARARR